MKIAKFIVFIAILYLAAIIEKMSAVDVIIISFLGMIYIDMPKVG